MPQTARHPFALHRAKAGSTNASRFSQAVQTLDPEKHLVMARRNRTSPSSRSNATKYADPEPAQGNVKQDSTGLDGGPNVGSTDREATGDSPLNETGRARCI